MSTATNHTVQLRTLDDLERVVERGLDTFIEVGQALAEIRDRKLYVQAGAHTFESYVEERFGLKRSSAFNYIAAAETAIEVVQTSGQQPSLSQAVELAKLPPPERKAAAKVIDFSTATVREVRTKVKSVIGSTSGRQPLPNPLAPTWSIGAATKQTALYLKGQIQGAPPEGREALIFGICSALFDIAVGDKSSYEERLQVAHSLQDEMAKLYQGMCG